MAIRSAPLVPQGFATIASMKRDLRILLPLVFALAGCGGAETRPPTAEPGSSRAAVDPVAARPAVPARPG
ncbi:MAG: hypothetical protein O3A37_09690, partial [Planctomycetota bacterium]|nr:hypothetical protein [Planctomycetota bacterium]